MTTILMPCNDEKTDFYVLYYDPQKCKVSANPETFPWFQGDNVNDSINEMVISEWWEENYFKLQVVTQQKAKEMQKLASCKMLNF